VTRVLEISDWFDRGVTDEQSFMLVVCDTFDYENYPVYVATVDEAREIKDSPGNMQKVMEIYNLHADKFLQLELHRCWAV